MPIRRRALALWVLVLPLLAVAAACGGSAEPGAGAPAPVAAAPDQAAQAGADETAAEASAEGASDDAAAAAGGAVAVVTGAPVPPLAAGTVQAEASQTASGGRFPPFNDPRVVLPEAATWLRDDTLVLGAEQNGDARAYPVSMITFHHVINDVLGGEPYLVTF